MKKITGIFLLLVYVCVATTLLNERFIGAFNMQNMTRWSSMFGILGIGVAFVIITGGIDLSIGSVVGLIGCLLPMMVLGTRDWPPSSVASLTAFLLSLECLVVGGSWWFAKWRAQSDGEDDSRRAWLALSVGCGLMVLAVVIRAVTLPAWVSVACVLIWVLGISLHLGLVHGLLVTQARLQPFVVTLCGFLIYRGLARYLADDQPQGLGDAYDNSLRLLATGKPCSVALVVAIAGVAAGIWCGWRMLMERRPDGTSPRRGLLAFGVIAGLAIALIAAVRFAPDGVLGGLAANKAPGAVMNVFGWLVVPATLWLLVTAFRLNGQRLLAPLLSVLVGAGLLIIALWVVGKDDGWFVGGAAWAARIRMASVFLSLGILMGAIAWFGRSALRGGDAVQTPLAAAGTTSVLWLVSRRMGEVSLADTLLGEMLVPAPFFVMLVVAVIAAIFLNQTIYGRYLLALGRNEQAARFSGIKTDRLVVLAYVLCGGAAGLGGVLFTLDGNSVQPSGHGSVYELYAIAAAVLGACSLRGGEGSIVGVIIGATVVRVLYNAIGMLGIPSTLEYTIIGVVILGGVIADETVKRMTARKRLEER
ncbi:MAG: hypothetical protein U1A77_11355 [Pirellulales bacterium]